MSRRGIVACVVALVAGLCTASLASGSQGRLLGLPIGTTVITTVTDVVTTVTDVVTDPTGVVQTTTGTVTSTVTDVVTDVVDTTSTAVSDVTGVVDTATGGAIGGTVDPGTGGTQDAVSAATAPSSGTGATMPAGSLTTLLVSVFGPSAAAPPAGVADTAPPRISFKVLTRLAAAARSGKLKLRVAASEPAVVALSGVLRPGQARRLHGKALKVSHAAVRTKALVLAFRRAGPMTVTVAVPGRARPSLRNARTARISLQAWAADLARNQARRTALSTIRR